MVNSLIITTDAAAGEVASQAEVNSLKDQVKAARQAEAAAIARVHALEAVIKGRVRKSDSELAERVQTAKTTSEDRLVASKASAPASTQCSSAPAIPSRVKGEEPSPVETAELEWDSGDLYARMMRRNLFNEFTLPGLEAAYRAFLVALWRDAFQRWVLLAAFICTTGSIYIRATMHTPAAVAHPSLFAPMAAFSALFWCGLLVSRCAPERWLRSFFALQQSFLSALALGFILVLTLPVLCVADGTAADNARMAAGDLLEHGRFQATLPAAASVVLAWSDLSPLRFSVICLVGFALWTQRNLELQQRMNGALPAEQQRQLDGSTYAAQLSLYITTFIAAVSISFQKDTLTRKNFVILRLVNAGKDHRIKTLTGEKKKLEFMVAVRRAQAAEAVSHVKFVDPEQRASSSVEGRTRAVLSHRDDASPQGHWQGKSAAGKLRVSRARGSTPSTQLVATSTQQLHA